ncbi:MAG: MFS transporter [Planctomycetota bacterium]|jgi:MFS family permease
MTEVAAPQSEDLEQKGRNSYGRNYFLVLFNGTLARLGNSLIDPHLVLAAFVYGQTRSSLLVGVLTALGVAGHRLPQLYVSSLIEHHKRKKRFYIGASVVRVALLLAIIATMLLCGRNGHWLVMAAFFAVYFVFRAAQGCASIPFLDILTGAIGPSRIGGFFAVRHFLGGGVTLLAGLFLVQPILDHVPEPSSYAILTGVAVVVLAAAWGSFALFHEKANDAPPEARNLRESFADGRRTLRCEPNYRKLLWLRLLAHVNGLILVFYVPYGVEKLGAVGISGVFLGCVSGSRLISSLLWGRVSNRKGNRLCLIFAGLFFALNPLAALLAPRLPEAFRWTIPATSVSLDLPLLVYLLALACFGFAQQANMIGTTAFVLESAPEGRRPSYFAFLNTVTFPMTFLPALAGVLVGVGLLGLDALFGCVVVSGLLTLLLTLRLTEVRAASPA